MWLDYESCEFRTDLESRKGDKYSAFVLSGNKRGWKEEPDAPWSKTIFENTFAKVNDRNGSSEMVINEFFDMCNAGDLIVITQKKEGDFWQITELENKTRSVLPEGSGAGAAPSVTAQVADGWGAAVNFVNVLVNNGHYKDKTNPEILLDAVVTYRLRLDALDSVALDSPVEELDEAA